MKKNKLDIDIKLGDAPNEKYEKFFKKFEEIDILETSLWNATHILGYFCKKYHEQYKIKYQFKFNSPIPSKCFEVFQIKKLGMQLTSNPILLKEYIDWIFSNKVVKAKRKLTSISFITNEGFMNEYKFNILWAEKTNLNVDRSTLLLDKYKVVFLDAGVVINTYGDLAFMSQINDMSTELKTAFLKIEEMGFNKNILNKIV